MSHGLPEEQLATAMARLRLEDVRADVRAFARLVLLDAIASAFTGRQTAERPRLEELARDLAGPGSSAVIGGQTLAPLGATFLNGFQITAATICDVHRATMCHVTPEVVPAALAAAEATGADGPQLLTALIAGLETTVRVAAALDGPAFRGRGWHQPGIAGPFGAAVAAGLLHGLDGRGLETAFGHAAGQAAGTFAALGTSGVKFHQARGGVSGLLAARLAVAGLDASKQALTAPFGGLLAAYADGGTPAALTQGLGESWRLTELSLRRWPGASSVQAVIEAMLELVGLAGADDVEHVRVALPPRSFELSGSAGWHDQLSALQSARYVAAVVLRDGGCWLEQFDEAHLADPSLDAFARERVEVVADGSLPQAGVAVTVRRAGGRTTERAVDAPPGSPARPLTHDDIVAKLQAAADGLGIAHRVGPITDMIDRLETLTDLRRLTTLLAIHERTPAR